MAKAKKKYKTFQFHNKLKWTGNRVATLQAEDKPDLTVSSPPEFKGEADKWSPEDLFVGAVNICTMTTFLAFANHKDLPLDGYESGGEGLLERVESGYEFTKVTLRPKIVVAGEEHIESAKQILHDAHEKCLVSNSIKGEVVLEPEITAA